MPSRIRHTNSHSEDSDETATVRRRPRISSHRSHTLAAETERNIVRPARRALKTGVRRARRTARNLPAWLPWAAGAAALGGILYLAFQSDAVANFFDGMEDNDLYASDEDFEENGYDGSDYGERSAGGL